MPKTWRIGLDPVRGLSNENVLSPDQKLAKHWLSAWLPGLARSPGPGGPERPGSLPSYCHPFAEPALWQCVANTGKLPHPSLNIRQSVDNLYFYYLIQFIFLWDSRLKTSPDSEDLVNILWPVSWTNVDWVPGALGAGSRHRSCGVQSYKDSGHLAISDGQYPGPWSWHRPASPTGHQPLEGSGDMRVNQNKEIRPDFDHFLIFLSGSEN